MTAPTRTEFEAAAYRWLRDGVLADRDEALDTAIAAAMGWPTVPEQAQGEKDAAT